MNSGGEFAIFFQAKENDPDSVRRAMALEIFNPLDEDDAMIGIEINNFIAEEYNKGHNDVFDFLYEANAEIFQGLCQEFFTHSARNKINIEAFKKAGLLSELKTCSNHSDGPKAGAVKYMKDVSSYLAAAASSSILKPVCGSAKILSAMNSVSKQISVQNVESATKPHYVDQSLDVNIANKQRKVRGL